MEGKRISQLTPDTSPSTDDFIVTVDGTTLQNKRVDLGSLPVSNPTNALFDTKVDKAPGKQLSDQNYTQDEKNKLAGIEDGAEVNEVSPADLALKADITALTAHEAKTDNPHSVTKAQVGLGNVDNTSDANKPVSTAQATAIGAKVNKAGDTMTGKLDVALSVGDVAYSQNRAGTKIKWGVGTNSVFGVYNETSGTELLNVWADNLRLGTQSGVGFIYGTGFPQGVVSAPVGSTYIDRNATNGAIEWKKATGTGPTGWIVSVGDTGWRNITSLVNTSYFTTTPAFNNYINVRIKDGRVHIVGRLVPHTDVGVPERQILASFSSLDTAYRSALPDQMFVLAVDTSDLNTPPLKLIRGYMNSGGQFGTLYWLAGRSYNFSVSYDNTGAWPASLPGTPL